MQALSQRVIESVSAWDGVTAQPHRFGGVEFMLGKVEVGHIHVGTGLVDIPFTRRTREALIAAGEAELHHILPASGWISFWMRSAADADQSIRLYRLSYLQKRFRRAPNDATLQAELELLRFGGAVLQTLSPTEPETE